MAKGGGRGPSLGCVAKFIKYLLVIFNLVFFLLGIAIAAIGIYVLVDPSFAQLKQLTNSDVLTVASQNGINLNYIDKCAIAFIVFGGLMLLISFMGCCGALRHVKCLLGLYSTILLGLLLAEIAVGIFAGVYASKLRDILTPLLRQSIKEQYMGDMSNKTLPSVAWDAIMLNFGCCGVVNYTDFDQTNNVWTVRNDYLVPRSCCKFKYKISDWSGVIPNITAENGYPECPYSPNYNNSYIGVGCYDKIQSLVNSSSVIVIAVAIGIGVILFTGVFFGFYLCRKIDALRDYA